MDNTKEKLGVLIWIAGHQSPFDISVKPDRQFSLEISNVSDFFFYNINLQYISQSVVYKLTRF